MKLIFIAICSMFSMLVTAQSTVEINDPNAKQRELKSSFSGISVSDGIILYLTQGVSETIAISSSDAKFEERFKTEIVDGVLKIYFDNKGFDWNLNGKRKLKAYVSFKTINKLNASGGSQVIVPGTIRAEEIEMNFSSGTTFTGKINASVIISKQSSGSSMEISGMVKKITLEATSGAMFKGFDLVTDYCSAKATSGGAIRISINKELDAKANSGGAIRYKGEAVIKEVNVNSGGIVKRA